MLLITAREFGRVEQRCDAGATWQGVICPASINRRLPDHQKAQPGPNFQHLKTDLLSSCRSAVDLLHSKAPRQEVIEYSYAVLNIGIHVANAAREGDTTSGGPRQKISQDEAAVLKEVSEALGISE